MKLIRDVGVAIATSATLLLVSQYSVAGAKEDPLLTMIKVDQLEQRYGDEDPFVIEAQAWVGYDLNKLWLKTRVERVDGENQGAEWQLLYGKAISAFWDLQVGVKQDVKPRPTREWAVIGVQGLAPYYIDVDAAFFVGESGRTAVRVNAEYELMLTQRWVLIPELEMNFFGKNDTATGTGSGLSDSELGLRLAYEVRREFAPYIGINWEKKYGRSADFAAAENEPTSDTQFVIGASVWF
jgi:copper resistance protein B